MSFSFRDAQNAAISFPLEKAVGPDLIAPGRKKQSPTVRGRVGEVGPGGNPPNQIETRRSENTLEAFITVKPPLKGRLEFLRGTWRLA